MALVANRCYRDDTRIISVPPSPANCIAGRPPLNAPKSLLHSGPRHVIGYPRQRTAGTDIYFSADIETDGSIPGPFSILSFALVYAGAFDGETFYRPPSYEDRFYLELKPISDRFEPEALRVNGLDRDALIRDGHDPHSGMSSAADWVRKVASGGEPVFVAYPLSFDWSWLYWYFISFSASGSPFGYSRCFDIKTAAAIKLGTTISDAGRRNIPAPLRPKTVHTHHALDDAIEQAEIFANLFELERKFDAVLP